eukprot:scpid34131/ scgid4256/ ETS domain-containing protein Elk-1
MPVSLCVHAFTHKEVPILVQCEHNTFCRVAVRSTAPHNLQRAPWERDTTGINLWEYLLELLAEPGVYSKIILWKDRPNGVFCLLDSEVVAMLWGLHRNKKTMNYDKMSRAMRYYYCKLIDKVSGSRLTYKFLPSTNWLTYVPKANGYDDQYAGNRSLVCHGRLSRRRPSNSRVSLTVTQHSR